MKIIKKIPREFLIIAIVILLTSLFSSIITYQLAKRGSPEIVMVDLAYLNNGFIVNLARYLTDHKLSEDEMRKMVSFYENHLDFLLQDISKSGNYLLLQKQMVISENVPDLTKEIEKALFQTISKKLNNREQDEKIEQSDTM